MKKDKEKTKVLFLMEQTDSDYPVSSVFAYFPEVNYNNFSNLTKVCYAHIGQHSGCSIEYAIDCEISTEEQYNDLKSELESLGYNMEIINKKGGITVDELPTYINGLRGARKLDLYLDNEEHFYWGANNKPDYQACCAAIDKIKYNGKGWDIYASYDVSSFEYWMLQQEEQNYIRLTISFDVSNIDLLELSKIYDSLCNARKEAERLTSIYNYQPDKRLV